MLAWTLPFAVYGALLALFTATNLAVFRRLPTGSTPAAAFPTVSIVIPARNEEGLAHGTGVVRWRGREYSRDETSF